VPEDIFLWTFMVQEIMTEADTLTVILMGNIPFRLISDPTPSFPPIFMPDALPAATLSLHPGF